MSKVALHFIRLYYHDGSIFEYDYGISTIGEARALGNLLMSQNTSIKGFQVIERN